MDTSQDWHPSSEKLLQFLASIPRTTAIGTWTEQFRRILRGLLDDVDHVSVIINGLACFTTAEQNWMKFFATESHLDMDWPEYMAAFHPEDSFAILPNELSLYEYEDEPRLGHMSPPSSIIYNRLKRDAPDVAQNHEPLAFEYHTDNEKFLGVIFLWRKLGRSPVSERDTSTLNHLREFIKFALEGAVARSEQERPLFRALFTAMARLVENAGLMDHEARVVGYLLLGLTYDQIADRMKISVNTVRKYITSVYRKAGVHSLSELYARHFLPWPG